jgi:hypothetical protein
VLKVHKEIKESRVIKGFKDLRGFRAPKEKMEISEELLFIMNLEK